MKQNKNNFFSNLAHSTSNIGDVFKNSPSGIITENIQNLIKILKTYLEDNKIKANQLFQNFDRDHNDLISFNEFCHGFERFGLTLCVGDFLDVFRYFDRQGTGNISLEAFYEALFGNKSQKLKPILSNSKPQLLEGKTITIIDEEDQINQERSENEKVFELITSMKKYSKLKTTPIYDYFKIYEDRKQEEIDFVEFLNLLEKLNFLITRGEAKKVFDFLAKSNGTHKIRWTLFYDCLTESVDLEEIKRSILKHLEENKINLRDFYRNYDLNHDGTLSFEEFKLFLNEMIPELNFVDIYELFLDIDRTKDEKISYEEFERFLLGLNHSYAIFDLDLKSDIKFLMNFLRKSLKSRNLQAKLFFEDYIDLNQSEVPVKFFKKVLKQMNSTIKEDEIELIVEYFGTSKEKEENAVSFDFTLFYLFIDCPVDFFLFFHAFYDYIRNSNSNFDYLFVLADLDEDSKLSIKEYNNFLKEIKIKDMNLRDYTDIFYFLAEKHENFIPKEKLRLFLEDFEQTGQIFEKKQEKTAIFEENLKIFSFQALKNDKQAAKKYVFFKFSETLPFLLEMNEFLGKDFKNLREFEEKIYEAFEDLTEKKDFLVSKVQFKLRLVKFHGFFTPMKISQFIEILNDKKTNKCDLEEFLFLLRNFEEVFYSKLTKDEKIVRISGFFFISFIGFLFFIIIKRLQALFHHI